MGHAGVEEHYERWFTQIDRDFRAQSLSALIVSLTPAGRVLDIGCGSGACTAALLRAGRRVTAVDPSERMVTMCRAHLEHHGFDPSCVRLGGVEGLDEEGAFDGVVALDVIEHIEDDVGALERMRRALRPEGRLVVSVPALAKLYGPKDVEQGHFRRYERDTLLDALGRGGFEVESVRFWNVLGVAPTWLSNLRGKRLDESMRYSRTLPMRALNAALGLWFRRVENPLRPPLGLTLIARARPR